MTFNQYAFNNFILDHQIISTFEKPITLKSGKKSSIYINWRTVAEDVFLMDQLTDFVLSFVQHKSISVNTFYGVPEGATKLGLITQFKFAKLQGIKKHRHQLAMGRAKPKDHGDPKDRYFVGAPKGSICVLEDVTTTGGSLINCIKSLQANGMDVRAAIGLTNRDEFRDDGKTVAEALAELSVPYYEMSNANQLTSSM